MAVGSHNQSSFVLGQRTSAPKLDNSQYNSVQELENYLVNTAGHLIRRKGLVKEIDVPELEATIRDIHPFNEGFIFLLENNSVYYVTNKSLVPVVFQELTVRLHDANFVYSLSEALPLGPSGLSSISIIETRGDQIWCYPTNSIIPFIIELKEDQIEVRPYFLEKNKLNSILELVRSYPLKLKDDPIDNPFSTNTLQDKVKLVIGHDSDLNNNTCKAWLGLREEDNFDGELDKGKIGLSKYLGKPLFFNVLPKDPSDISSISDYSVPHDDLDEQTSFSTRLLTNLDRATAISHYEGTGARRRNIMRQLLYGRKYCVIPHTLVDTSVDDVYDNIFPKSTLVTPPTTSGRVSSELLLSQPGFSIDLPPAKLLGLLPQDISGPGEYIPNSSKVLGTPDNRLGLGLEFRLGMNRWVFNGSGENDNREDYSITVNVTAEQLENSITEGVFFNGEKVNGLGIGLSVDADISDGDDGYTASQFRENPGTTLRRIDNRDTNWDVHVNIDVTGRRTFQSLNGETLSSREDIYVILEEVVGIMQNDGRSIDEDFEDDFFPLSSRIINGIMVFNLGFNTDRRDWFADAIPVITTVESGKQTIGLKRSADTNTSLEFLRVSVGEDTVSLLSEGTLPQASPWRDLAALYIEREVGAGNTLFFGGMGRFLNTLATIETIRVSFGETVNTIDLSSVEAVNGIKQIGVNEQIYEAFAPSASELVRKVEFLNSDNEVIPIEVSSATIDLKIAYGVSLSAGNRINYKPNEEVERLSIGGALTPIPDVRADIQSVGYHIVNKKGQLKWTPYLLADVTSKLAAYRTIRLSLGADTFILTKPDGTIVSENANNASVEFRLTDDQLFDSRPVQADKDVSYNVGIETPNRDGTYKHYYLTEEVRSVRQSQVYADCSIFEIGFPSPVIDNDIRVIGGNDFDKKESYVDRIIETVEGGFSAVTKVNKFFIGGIDNELHKIQEGEQGYSNNIIFRLLSSNSDEYRRIAVSAGVRLETLVNNSVDYLDYFTWVENESAYGEKGKTLLDNISYKAIEDYLGANNDPNTLGFLESSNITYGTVVQDINANKLKITGLTTSYSGAGVFVATDQGVYLTSVSGNPDNDLLTSIASKDKPILDMLVFSSKVNFITKGDDIVNLLGSEERRGFKKVFSGIEQKELLTNIKQYMYEEDSRRYYMLREDGNIVVALDIDKQIVGYSLVTFNKDVDEYSIIKCLRLFNTKGQVKGLFEYSKYNDDTEVHEKTWLIGSFSNDNCVDLEGETDSEGDELIYHSFLRSNALVVNNVIATQGSLYLGYTKKIKIFHSKGIEQIQVGQGGENDFSSIVLSDYFTYDQDVKVFEFPETLSFVDLRKVSQNYITLSQLGKTNKGSIYGFQAQGDIDGVS